MIDLLCALAGIFMLFLSLFVPDVTPMGHTMDVLGSFVGGFLFAIGLMKLREQLR